MSQSPTEDEFRVEVELDDDEHHLTLGERLRAVDLDDEARERLGSRVIVTRDGSHLFLYANSQASCEEAERVVSEQTARELSDMMQNVVEQGTGTSARLEGVDVSGKTGTAEVNNNDLNDAWFIGFTDRFAVAVVIERVQGGTGGELAAPIAAKVLKSLGEG